MDDDPAAGMDGVEQPPPNAGADDAPSAPPQNGALAPTTTTTPSSDVGGDAAPAFIGPALPAGGAPAFRAPIEATYRLPLPLEALMQARVNGNGDDNQYSKRFECGGWPWRLLVQVPHQGRGQLGLFLDSLDWQSGEHAPRRETTFQLAVLDQADLEAEELAYCYDNEKQGKLDHVFTEQSHDYGFKTFMDWSKLGNSEYGYVKDTHPAAPEERGARPEGGDKYQVMVEVRMTCFPAGRPPKPDYNSRDSTGFVGLQNQGATCYMNSLLQTLFLLPRFRRAVYQIPSHEDDISKSIPLALQRLFYRMQSEDNRHAVDTRELTCSFGWDTADAFTQHDVQELNRILCDNLEEKMKGTPAEGEVNMFVGKTRNYVACVNVDYTSTRDENFYDLQLSVKGFQNLYESLDDYVVEETLDGENQYDASDQGHGKQDAKKGTRVKELPDVLNLHLRRFEYDMERDAMGKINDAFEFQEQIALSKYMADGDDVNREDEHQTFSLHSVLVHSGTLDGGHYYAFVRPDAREGGKWYKFDDECVTEVKAEEAVQRNWGDAGGSLTSPKWRFPQFQKKRRNDTSAYMLVYVRNTAREQVLAALNEQNPDDIPSALLTRLKTEAEQDMRKEKERREAHLFVNVRVADDAFLKANAERELLPLRSERTHIQELSYDHSGVKTFRVRKTDTVQQLIQQVAHESSADELSLRLWKFITRANGTKRPTVWMEPGLTVGEIFSEQLIKAQKTWNTSPVCLAYAERVRPGDDQPPDSESGSEVLTGSQVGVGKDVIVFFKRFEPAEHYGDCKLTYECSAVIRQPVTYEKAEAAYRELAAVPPEVELRCVEELCACVGRGKKQSFVMATNAGDAQGFWTDQMGGDILIFAPKYPPETAITVDDCMFNMAQTAMIQFRVKPRGEFDTAHSWPKLEDGKEAVVDSKVFRLKIIMQTKYDDVASTVAAKLDELFPLAPPAAAEGRAEDMDAENVVPQRWDPMKLQFFPEDSKAYSNGGPSMDRLKRMVPARNQGDVMNELALMTVDQRSAVNTLFWDTSVHAIPELEAGILLSVEMYDQHVVKVGDAEVLVGTDGLVVTLAKCIAQLDDESKLPDEMKAGSGAYVLLDVFNSKVDNMWQMQDEVRDRDRYAYDPLMLIELSEETVALLLQQPNAKLVPVYQFYFEGEDRTKRTVFHGVPFLVALLEGDTPATAKARIRNVVRLPVADGAEPAPIGRVMRSSSRADDTVFLLSKPEEEETALIADLFEYKKDDPRTESAFGIMRGEDRKKKRRSRQIGYSGTSIKLHN